MYRTLWYNNASVDQKDKIQAIWQILTAKEPAKSWLILIQLGLKITNINIAHKHQENRDEMRCTEKLANKYLAENRYNTLVTYAADLSDIC